LVAIPLDLLPAYQLLFAEQSAFLPTLDARTLKRVYRRKALDTHPDRARTTGTDPLVLTRRFQEVTAAYERLVDFLSGKPCVTPPTPRPAASRPRPPPARPPSARAHTPPHHASAHTHAPPRGPRPTSKPAGSSARPASQARSTSQPHAASPPKEAASGRFTSTAADHFWTGRVPDRELLFGQFLYYSGRVSFRSLIGAIHWQRTQRPHLGQLAVQAGFLDAELVHRILMQKRFDERTGDAAVRLGFLTPRQRDLLVGLQRTAQKPLGLFFVQAGSLAAEELRRVVSQQQLHNWTRGSGRSTPRF
jgi:hypothetical protein